MRNKTRIFVLLFVITIFISGCDLFKGLMGTTVSIEERIVLFQTELNKEDRSEIYLHFHPDTQNRQQIAASEVIETGPLAYDYQPYAINIVSQSDPDSAGKVTVSCGLVNKNTTSDNPYDLTLIMQEGEKNVWYIRELHLTVGKETYTIKRIGI
ncbi:MAG: hypothetical protein DRP87_18700 [Spirochaetes bacterium]|mgnify:CR=1 FL=1|nr:MAG: hypothetical protein DRP87_18700 [Spirochaetota bacterium]